LKVKCVHAKECITPCSHKNPHEPVRYGRYAHHNCKDEMSIMCGVNSNGYRLDGICVPIEQEQE